MTSLKLSYFGIYCVEIQLSEKKFIAANGTRKEKKDDLQHHGGQIYLFTESMISCKIKLGTNSVGDYLST